MGSSNLFIFIFYLCSFHFFLQALFIANAGSTVFFPNQQHQTVAATPLIDLLPALHKWTCLLRIPLRQRLAMTIATALRVLLGWPFTKLLQVRLADQARYHHALTVSSLGNDCQARIAPLLLSLFSYKQSLSSPLF